ncbi:unnamed protein product [Calypogeia fissa]
MASSSTSVDEQLQNVLKDIGDMDPDERDALEKTLNLEGDDKAAVYVEKVVATMLTEIEERKLGHNESRVLQKKVTHILHEDQKEEAQEILIEIEKAEKERGEELARKWDKMHLKTEEKDELIQRLLNIIEDMQEKMRAQKGQIEEQKQSIQRLGVQLSMLRKKFNFERRKAGTSKPIDVNYKIGGVLREHTRILQDCVFLMRRQILELKRRDSMYQEHEKKVFNECYEMISKQIAELKKTEDNFKSVDYAQLEKVVKTCIQTLTNHATELQQREELARDSQTKGRSNSIYNDFCQVLKSHITGMLRRKNNGDSTEEIFDDCVKLLNHRIVLLKKKGAEFYGERTAKELEAILQKLSNNMVDLQGERRYGADSDVIFESCIEMLSENITELEANPPGYFSDLETSSMTSRQDGEAIMIAMELKEVEDLVNILDSERKKQQLDLSDHLGDEFEDTEGSESNLETASSAEQNATNENSRDPTHLEATTSVGGNYFVEEPQTETESLPLNQQNGSIDHVTYHIVLEQTSHIETNLDGSEQQLSREPQLDQQIESSIQQEKVPTSRDFNFESSTQQERIPTSRVAHFESSIKQERIPASRDVKFESSIHPRIHRDIIRTNRDVHLESSTQQDIIPTSRDVHFESSTQQERTPTSRHAHIEEEHDDYPQSSGYFHTENIVLHHQHREEGPGIIAKLRKILFHLLKILVLLVCFCILWKGLPLIFPVFSSIMSQKISLVGDSIRNDGESHDWTLERLKALRLRELQDSVWRSERMKHLNQGLRDSVRRSSDKMKDWNHDLQSTLRKSSEKVKDWNHELQNTVRKSSDKVKDWNLGDLPNSVKRSAEQVKDWNLALPSSVKRSAEKVRDWNLQELQESIWGSSETPKDWSKELSDVVRKSSQRIKEWSINELPDSTFHGVGEYESRVRDRETLPPGKVEVHESFVETIGTTNSCSHPRTENSWWKMAKDSYQAIMEMTYLAFFIVTYFFFILFETFSRTVGVFISFVSIYAHH